MRSIFITSFLALTLLSAAYGQDSGIAAERQSVSDAYLAKDDRGKVGNVSEDFDTGDSTIYCVVVLSSTRSATVKMNLVAVSVRGVRPETKVVATTYTTREGENQVSFSGSAATNWTAGEYRADIFLNGAIAKKIDFLVRPKETSKTEPEGSTNFAPRVNPPRKRSGT